MTFQVRARQPDQVRQAERERLRRMSSPSDKGVSGKPSQMIRRS